MFMSVHVIIFSQFVHVLHWPKVLEVGTKGEVPLVVQAMKWVLAQSNTEPP